MVCGLARQQQRALLDGHTRIGRRSDFSCLPDTTPGTGSASVVLRTRLFEISAHNAFYLESACVRRLAHTADIRLRVDS